MSDVDVVIVAFDDEGDDDGALSGHSQHVGLANGLGAGRSRAHGVLHDGVVRSGLGPVGGIAKEGPNGCGGHGIEESLGQRGRIGEAWPRGWLALNGFRTSYRSNFLGQRSDSEIMRVVG